ncbi:hypothetical protein L6R53_17815 [Myxococcota bacterium]|nr:hypothetical protein [Myxococcota bacterium]
MPLPSLDTLKLNARLVAHAVDRFGADLLSATFDAYGPPRIFLSERAMTALCAGRVVTVREGVRVRRGVGVEALVDGVVYLGSVDPRLVPLSAAREGAQVRLYDRVEEPPPTRAA